MHMLVLVAVEASASVYEDCGDRLLLLPEPKHAVESTVGAVLVLSHHGGGRVMVAAIAIAHNRPGVMGRGG